MTVQTPQNSIVTKLQTIPIFMELPPSEAEALSRMVTLRRYPKGSFIVTRNERGTSMFLLVAGRVKVSLVSPDGRELTLSYLEAPTHFGEMAVVDSGPRAADIVSITDVEVLVLEARDLSAAIRIQPRLALALVATLSKRLRSVIDRLEDVSFHDAGHRVKRVLLNVATAAYDAIGVPVVSGLTHYEIGTLAGTSRETASRVISQLAREGILLTRGRKIIVDLFKLKAQLDAET
jgi:CRP-like cAMP-binding protein